MIWKFWCLIGSRMGFIIWLSVLFQGISWNFRHKFHDIIKNLLGKLRSLCPRQQYLAWMKWMKYFYFIDVGLIIYTLISKVPHSLSLKGFGSFGSFQFSVVSDSLWPHALQHARLPCPSPTPRVYLNSCPLSWWCHPTISSSVVLFCSCLQFYPASGSFQMSQFFALSGQNIGALASASVLQMNIQDWFPLGWTGWISVQCKGLSRVFSNTTVQNHQFFRAQLSL